jgi:hypothetical protein
MIGWQNDVLIFPYQSHERSGLCTENTSPPSDVAGISGASMFTLSQQLLVRMHCGAAVRFLLVARFLLQALKF